MWNASWTMSPSFGVLHEIIMLGAVARDADRVRFLERVGADQVRRDLAGDDDDRDRIHQRIGEPGDDVRRAGTGCDEHDARLARRPRIAFGGMRRAAFLADEDVADTLLLEQRVVDRQDGAAGIAEHDLDAEIAQRLDQYVRATLLARHPACP